MHQEQWKDVVIRFCLPFKISVLLITFTALFVFIPPAVQAIPAEALGPMIFFLAIPAVLVYASFFVFTYQLRITTDRIAAEAIPNPFLHSFQCMYADISAIEKDTWWSSLCIYRFKEYEPFRISFLELLDGSPADLLDEVKARIPRDVFIERPSDLMRRIWKWHRLLTNVMVLLAVGWFSVQLLEAGGVLAIAPMDRATVPAVLLVACLILGFADWLIFRSINRDS